MLVQRLARAVDARPETPRRFRCRDIVPGCVALLAVMCAGPILFRIFVVPGWEDTIAFADARAVRELLAAGFDPNRTTLHGGTPPMALAVGSPDEAEKVRLFLAAGADPNRCSPRGYTALHEAAWRGTAETCRLLLTAGADPRARDDRGGTPLDRAWRRGDPGVLAVFGLPNVGTESQG